MSVALFFISHEGIAGNMLSMAEAIMRQPPANIRHLEIPMDAPLAELQARAQDLLAELDTRDGLLLFTDTFGSTPGNMALRLARQHHTRLISGINLPMILRLLNYREQALDDLLQTAIEGGRKGIEQHE